jgi:methionine-rich copper-binding protein CopC
LFDRLETRTALSGSTFGGGFSFSPPGQPQNPTNSDPLTITSTSPADQSQLTSSPSTIEVTFNQALEGFSLGLADFQLLQINSDGSTSPLSQSQAQLVESLDTSNMADDQIDLSLSRPLGSGKYELILNGSNQISGLDGETLADVGQNQVLSHFNLSPPESSLSSATHLGSIGSNIVTSTGDLNLSANPGAVNYYELTIEPGHHWSLGLAVNSSGMLATTLSLFNADDQLIATSSTGLESDPGDPFLFTGLDPGTYYVGISAEGNVPDANGNYNPADLTSQEAGAGSLGGTYQLQAVAEVADQPTQILGVRIDEADPLVKLPTGLTLQFSGALQLAGLDQPYDPPLQLVDQTASPGA